MPDVSSTAPADVNQWIVFDVHKNSLVAGVLPASGGTPQVSRLENTERSIRRFIDRAGETSTLAVAYEAGPCGYDLFRFLSGIGVACDVIAPSLIPVRAGDRVKTDRRDAKKLVRLYRAGELFFVAPPTPAQEGLRDLVRCRDDLRCARTAARHRVAKALLRHGHIYREGKQAWTVKHREWLDRQRLDDPLAQLALEQMRAHLGGLDAQLATLDHELAQIAEREPWADPVAWLCSFRGIATHTALGLLAEIGDFRRFGHPRELMSYLGLTPSEYSSGDQQHRGQHWPRPVIATPGACWSRPPGTISTPPASPNGSPPTAATSHPRSPPVPGRHRSVCTIATGPSAPTASARPSPLSPWRASSAASSGPR